MFPIIEKLDDLLPHIESNKQIRVKADESTGLIVVCYMVQDEDTFAGTDLKYAIECRGITFATDGRIAARTLHKFFNVGEHDSVQPNVLPWSQVDRIMEKRDGSMITPVPTPGAVDAFAMKTKKTFTSKEAGLAMEVARSVPGGYDFISWVLSAGMTPTFEITSPKFPIVIKYEKDELTLLHIRENVTGRYLSEREILDLEPPFPIVENVMAKFVGAGVPANLVSWDLLHERQLNAEGLEGWVVQFKSGDMIKIKTAWYVALHHSVTFTRWRDIARSVVADQADDLKGAFAMTGRSIEPILKVERQVKFQIESIKGLVESVVKSAPADATAKDMALKWNGDAYFGLIMRAFKGQEPDYMAWYVKNHLDNDWGLEVVGDDA